MNLALRFAALLVFPLISFAQNPGSPASAPLEMTVEEGDQLRIQGLHAQVTLNGTTGGSSLKVKGLGENGFTFERKDKVLWIHGKESDNRKEWKENLKAWEKLPTAIEITGGSLPTEIHLRQGGVQINKWGKEVRLDLRDGNVAINQSSGAFRLNLQKGNVTVAKSSGRLMLDMFQGQVTLNDLNADADLHLFSSSLAADGGKGHWSLFSSNANAKIQKFAGTLQLDLSKGSLSATAFQGRAEGQTGESSVTLAVLPETDVNLKSVSGRLQVNLPPQTGVFLNLAAGDGEIVGPSDLRVSRTATEKTLRARYRGEGSLSVTLRTQDGNIVVK